MSSSRLSELSSIIATHTAAINAYLVSRNLPPPSFLPGPPSDVLSDEAVAESRRAILEATDELHNLMLGPVGILTSPYHNFLISLQAICHYDLATTIPEDQEQISMAEMASGTDMDESTVSRLLRHAISYHVFHEPRKGYIAHTGASKYLAENHHMRQWLGMVSGEMWPAATKTVEALGKWPKSDEPNQTGFNLAHDTDRMSFDELAIYPQREERYAAAMEWFSAGPGLEVSHVAEGFDWTSLGEATVVDVGGSHGSLGIALTSSFPLLSCIVQDRIKVVNAGKSKLPAHLSSRITFMEHDFFEEQPVKAAAVYVLRWILHDWSDTYAVKILRALTPALSTKSKILICELVLPQPGTVSTLRDRSARALDLAMLEFHNGKERDFDDWVELLGKADHRFHLVNMIQPPGSRLTVIEVGWSSGSQDAASESGIK